MVALNESERHALKIEFHSAIKLGIRYTERKIWNARKTEYKTPETRVSNGVPVALIDPNNEAVYFWAVLWRHTQQPARLIHIDAHDDMITKGEGLRPHLPEGKDFRTATLEEIFRYVHHLGFASFLEPAVQQGLIYPVVQWMNPHNNQAESYRYETEPYPHFRSLSLHETREAYEKLPEDAPLVVDIDLVGLSSLRDESKAHAVIDRRIAIVETILSSLREKPACVTIAQSRTPIPYVPADTLGYAREKTLGMVERVTR